MKATVTYNTINGKIYSETRNGVSTAFVSDPLGNVIKCRDSEGNQTYEAWYWPYGEIRESSGTNPSSFGFCGTLGYYTDDNSHIYVRARYYRPNLTRWQTVDPLWPDEPSYGYAASSPETHSDSSGNMTCSLLHKHPPKCHCADPTAGPFPPKKWQHKWDSIIAYAMAKECKKCPRLSQKDFACQIMAESDGDPLATTGDNVGLMQISREIWNENCKDIAPFNTGVINPIDNILCGIRLVCNHFHCNMQRYGTDTGHGTAFSCCLKCLKYPGMVAK